MSLADERRAIARGISEARQATQLVSDLNSLQDQRRSIRTLNELERRGARPATPGRGVWKAPATSGGGGIAGPLQEVDLSKREYFEYRNVPTSDGLFVFLEQSIKKVVLRDANNVDTEFIYLQEPV
ncbi:hypothetical protein P3T65_26275 [Pseudomonas nitroreducens]|uniref:Uncharacterized protein n=1 Tax=Pseudomonas nitroreducens TaxID=46680 RepID=A0ABS0KRT9_PSENT|nr:hypothetical protein [Pseudomonas nitroreducens]MBG6290797.1 hypothetical protein [Pseudomonas nitroreducens]WEW97695.1 hypothetical protein P3T65_26275 [Pseudomonas nitroreducens]